MLIKIYKGRTYVDIKNLRTFHNLNQGFDQQHTNELLSVLTKDQVWVAKWVQALSCSFILLESRNM